MANRKFMDYAEEIMDFFESKGVKLEPRPAVKFVHQETNRFDPFVPTGNYNYANQEITLYTSQRHAKDILRSFAHELIHHSQYVSDPAGYESFDKAGKVADNEILRKYESEAYTKGNLLFREWTEDYTA